LTPYRKQANCGYQATRVENGLHLIDAPELSDKVSPLTTSRFQPAALQRFSLFGLGFSAAAAGVVGLAFMAIAGEGVTSPDGTLFRVLLAIEVGLVAAMAVWTGARVMQRLRGRRFAEPAPRLQMRFLALFAVAALAPALLMLAFNSLVLNRGIEFWFGERVNTLVEASADLTQAWPNLALNTARIQFTSAADNLSYPDAVQGLSENRILYRNYLSQQAVLRNIPALYVIDSQATVLARSAEAEEVPAYTAPTSEMFQIANEGDLAASNPVTRDDHPDFVRLLVRLPNYEDAYLYGVWYVDFSIVSAQAAAVASYNEAVAREARMRDGFLAAFALAAIVILLGAVWLALSAAQNVTGPVSRLVSAAERVRRGDLEARVQVAHDDDEIAALGRTFNRMTRQLSAQRSALLDANAEAERRRAFIEAVLSGVSAGVIGVDQSGQITLVNRSACALLSREPDDLVGRPAHEAAPMLLAVMQDVERRPGEIAERQIDVAAPDGAVLNLNVRAGADDEGGLVLTFDDVTRLVAAQRNAAWRDVARRIAHEIKNPLTPIQLPAERLRRKYRDQVADAGVDVFDRCVDTIVRQVSDIGRMVDEFSSFARMPAPKMEQIDLSEIARGAVFAQRVASPDIRVPLSVPEAPVLVECDGRLAGQALANILKNAAESVSARMDTGTEKTGGSIKVQVYRENGFGVIEARDDGLGWPTADRARLTEPYMTTREKGTGLGLAIVRRVMEDHGGRLELDEPGGGEAGAVVRLAFPLLETSTGARETPESAEA
jgi:two-component system nitrogen regulation sensor histidine kinase NtrY